MKAILIFIGLMMFSNAKAGYTGLPFTLTATEKYQPLLPYAIARVTIDYANADKVLRKPLIVFEGFDPGILTNPDKADGKKGFKEFIEDLRDDADFPDYTQLQLILNGTLLAPYIGQEYDLVWVDWVNGTDFIQNNMYAAMQVIKWVNTNKVLVGGVKQPNVVMGKSMGSIIARMALKTFENRFASTAYRHNTRLYVSIDGGQQGSNIPQGLQHLNNQFRDLYIATGPTAVMAESLPLLRKKGSPFAKLLVNETPASRQLSINHVNLVNQIDNNLYASFQTELRNLGYPNGDGVTQLKKIAISNGSECAKPQPVGNGGNLFTYKGKISPGIWLDILGVGTGLTTTVGAVSVFAAVPLFTLGILPGRNEFNFDFAVNAKADGVANQIYKGKLSYTKKVLSIIPVSAVLSNLSFNANASTLAYDYFPGGYQDLGEELKLPKAYSDFWIEKNIIFTHQPACHVPVASALDIGSGMVTLTQADYFTPYRGSNPPTGTKSSPFANGFITEFGGIDNELHTTIEVRNGNWLADKLNGGNAQPANCEIVCGGATISGADMLCSGQSQYTIPGFPAIGATVVWQSSNNSIATASSTGLLTKGAGNGAITLTATITACGRDLVITKPVFVGTPDPSKFIIYNDQPCAGYPVGFGAYYEEGTFCSLNRAKATNVEWEVVSPYSYQINSNSGMGYCDAGNINNSGVTINFYRNYSSYTAQVRFRAQNACGWSGWSSYKTLTVQPCGSGLMAKITPNPATGTATIAVEEMAAAKTASIEKSGITQIKVVDKSGNIKLAKSFAKGLKQVQLNTSGLPSDIYSVHILYGKEWTVQKLMVQH